MDARACVNAVLVPDKCLIYNAIVDRDFIEQEHVVVIKHELRLKQLPMINGDFESIIDANFLSMVSECAIRIGTIPDIARQHCIDLITEYGDCLLDEGFR